MLTLHNLKLFGIKLFEVHFERIWFNAAIYIFVDDVIHVDLSAPWMADDLDHSSLGPESSFWVFDQ